MKRNNKNKKTYVAPLSKAIMLQPSTILAGSKVIEGGVLDEGGSKQGFFFDEFEDDSESLGWDD